MRWLLLALAVCLAYAADKSKFKTCEQVGFCKRHRQGQERVPYSIIPSSVKANETALLAQLKSKENTLELAVIVLKDSTLRIFADESGERQRARYIPYDAFVGLPTQEKISEVKIEDTKATFVPFKNKKVVVNYNPFWVEVYDKEDLLIAVNSNGLFKFEHFRNQGSEPEKDGEGFWEEKFSSWTDSKPFGSSAVGLDVEFFGFKYLYGLPEHAMSLALKSTLPNQIDPYRIYNVDIFEYEMNSPMSLYGGSPLVIAHNKYKTVGAYWFNVADTWVDVHSSALDKGIVNKLVDKFTFNEGQDHAGAHFMSEAGVADLFLFLGPTPNDIYRQEANLAGTHPLPPITGIAYHQCRWNYNDEKDVLDVDKNFDKYDIPYDTIWLDIEHTDGKRYFTWDPDRFPNPQEMIKKIETKSRSVVTIVDPHVKKDENYPTYQLAKERDYYVKNAGGQSDYEGDCWPGRSSYLDLLNPQVREYLADRYLLENYHGSTERLWTWNDMNEPSVFSGPEMSMPRDNIHHGGWENREIHNIYGMLYHNSTYFGHLRRSNNKLRPFILTRSFFTGTQRTSAIWTGDNAAEWIHLKATIPMLLSLSIAGFPNVGADVGGFFGNPTEELLVRWYQAGAFQPFFRAHAHLDSKRREPWLFSDETRNNIRDAVIRRYQLLPYWYTLFYEHSKNGKPIMRPIWSEFPGDENGFDEEREYMLGNALLVRPVTDPEVKSVSLYIPGYQQVWYDWDTGKMHVSPGAIYTDTPMSKIPVYQRGGTIVPVRTRIRRSAALMRNDPITLYIASELNRDFANGTLYLDDGESYGYKDGDYMFWSYTYKKNTDFLYTITSKNLDKNGQFDPDVYIEKIIIRGVRYYPRNVHLYYDDYNPEDLEFTHDRELREVVIRKPNAFVSREWRIDIHI
ncbi:unnamed protein product [Bursaphelenchus okinawaensis]|uniref:Glycoside hydrolase family 31 N-terminal domain-containing protein n=1 Tax=Bursaphelenchus okinawaensis TaxID=465554 RepID=A0A811L804_9BILA|nr:unnamed protein product [Bursaphelenchus okinawaensis]CAG9118737.1 unnamed protein product [Bursaphelenchus okinawaensis]